MKKEISIERSEEQRIWPTLPRVLFFSIFFQIAFQKAFFSSAFSNLRMLFQLKIFREFEEVVQKINLKT